MVDFFFSMEGTAMMDFYAEVSSLLTKLGFGEVKTYKDWEKHFCSLDSLDMMDILYNVENHFDITIKSDKGISSFETLVEAVIEEKKNSVAL
jgi:acyl carrier protein